MNLQLRKTWGNLHKKYPNEWNIIQAGAFFCKLILEYVHSLLLTIRSNTCEKTPKDSMEPNHFQYYSKFIQTTALALVMYVSSVYPPKNTVFSFTWCAIFSDLKIFCVIILFLKKYFLFSLALQNFFKINSPLMLLSDSSWWDSRGEIFKLFLGWRVESN